MKRIVFDINVSFILLLTLCQIGLCLIETSSFAQQSPGQATSADYVWENVTMNAAFAARDGAGALTFQNKMWLLGGWNPIAADRKFFPMICNNEVWSSDDGKTWNLIKPNTFHDKSFDVKSDWEGRHTAGYVVYRNKMWIVGGDANQKHYQNDVWNSEDGKSWQLVSKDVELPWKDRVLHYTVVHQDKIWLIGGQSMPGFAESKEVFYRDVWTSTDGVRWNAVKPKEPFWSARGMIGGSAVMNGRIWILGGGTYDTPTTPTRNFYNDVWSSEDGETWRQETPKAPWHPRQYHDVAVWDNRLWVMEGYHQEGGNRNDVWYSSDGINWNELRNTPWKPRHAASLFVFQDSLWMVAGNNMEPDVWRLKRR
ncbi:MAG: hypothetical protein FJ267_05230 [Planctomycetes bacterium]|nr:hypothetical protein [Planctomycetota bacterium]